MRAVVHSLADTERDRNEIRQQGEPDTQRHRDRQLLLDELENSRVTKIALAKIESAVVPQHQEEALIGRLIEAKLLLQALDEFRIEALSAAIFGICRIDSGRSLQLAARAQIAPRRSRDPRGGPGIGAGELGDDPLHRTARRELYHNE